jgi:hypothetical protein
MKSARGEKIATQDQESLVFKSKTFIDLYIRNSINNNVETIKISKSNETEKTMSKR